MDFREVYFNEYIESEDPTLITKINDGNKPWHLNTDNTYLKVIPRDILWTIFKFYPGLFFYRFTNVNIEFCLNCGSTDKIKILRDGPWCGYNETEISRLDTNYDLGDIHLFISCYHCNKACVMKRKTKYIFQPIIIKELVDTVYGINTKVDQHFLDISDKKWKDIERIHDIMNDLLIVIDCFFIVYKLVFQTW